MSYKLPKAIIELSEANNWNESKLEWDLIDVHYEDDPGTCLCGHYPIKEICLLRNRENRNTAIVGNCCVKKFNRLPSGKIFDAIKRISNDIKKALNIEILQHAYGKGWINDWEYKFYVDTMRDRKFTEKKMGKRVQINEKVLRAVVNSHGA